MIFYFFAYIDIQQAETWTNQSHGDLLTSLLPSQEGTGGDRTYKGSAQRTAPTTPGLNSAASKFFSSCKEASAQPLYHPQNKGRCSPTPSSRLTGPGTPIHPPIPSISEGLRNHSQHSSHVSKPSSQLPHHKLLTCNSQHANPHPLPPAGSPHIWGAQTRTVLKVILPAANQLRSGFRKSW